MGATGRDGMRHDIVVLETMDPRIFGVDCSCGERWMAFWGEPNVEMIIDRHYEEHGVTKVVVFG